MRQLRFRAWNSISNEMIEWHDLCRPEVLSLPNLLNGFISHCLPLQYSGLTDKDNLPIYEGDIVYCDHWSPSRYQIQFIEGAFCLSNKQGQWVADVTHLEDSEGKHFKIIGNVHQNPELL